MREKQSEEDLSKRCHDTVERDSSKTGNKKHWENSKREGVFQWRSYVKNGENKLF